MFGIELDKVGLQFRVRQQGRTTLKDFVLNSVLRGRKSTYIEVNALKSVSLTVREGERLGIVGHNGAGKSTLLKLLAGIYPPTSGRINITGRITSMLDIGIGIEPDANGWDNMVYRGLLQGDTPAQVALKKQAIADFSELGSALDMPVRFYSSGMQVRLMFSIATAIDPEILLLDEILGAGDLSFREKAYRRMLELIDKARLIVLASHDMDSLKRMCSRVIWLDHGEIKYDGDPAEVIALYEEYMQPGHKAAA